jgi:hypothetical protein
LANPLHPDGTDAKAPEPTLYRVQKPLARMILLMLREDLHEQVEAWKLALDAGLGNDSVADPVISDQMRQVFAALGYTTGLRDSRITKMPRPAGPRPKPTRLPSGTVDPIVGANESLALPDDRG